MTFFLSTFLVAFGDISLRHGTFAQISNRDSGVVAKQKKQHLTGALLLLLFLHVDQTTRIFAATNGEKHHDCQDIIIFGSSCQRWAAIATKNDGEKTENNITQKEPPCIYLLPSLLPIYTHFLPPSAKVKQKQ